MGMLPEKNLLNSNPENKLQKLKKKLIIN